MRGDTKRASFKQTGLGANRTGKASVHLSSRLLRTLLGVTLVLIVVHLILQYLNFVIYHQQVGQMYELANRFDLDDESSVPTWWAQVLFLAIGLGAWLSAYLQPDQATRRLWSTVAALGLIFSLDEVAALHEHILQSVHNLFFRDSSPTGMANAWWLVAPLLLLTGAWLLWKMVRLFPRRTTVLLAVGGAVFLVGSVVADLLTSIAPRETFLNQGIMVAVEEGLELIGSVIVFYAIADYLEMYHYSVLRNVVSQLRMRPTLKRDGS